MTNTEKKHETTLFLLEKKEKPKKSIFFIEPNKKEFFKTKKYVFRTKRDYKKGETSKYITRGFWAKSDHKKFIEALYLYGCDWNAIQTYVKNRTYLQVRSHAQKFYNRLKNFKDEELGLDFTTPNVDSLDYIIKIIKEKELISEN